MRLLANALISKFGTNSYSIAMLYGDADSKFIPTMPSGITETEISKSACKLSREIKLPSDNTREYAFYFDSQTIGSYCKANSTDFNAGNAGEARFILANIDHLHLDELHCILRQIKNTVESDAFGGKFKCNENFLLDLNRAK